MLLPTTNTSMLFLLWIFLFLFNFFFPFLFPGPKCPHAIKRGGRLLLEDCLGRSACESRLLLPGLYSLYIVYR